MNKAIRSYHLGHNEISDEVKKFYKGSVFKRFYGFYYSETFSDEFFLNELGDWSTHSPGHNHEAALTFKSSKEDYVFGVDSKLEKSLIKKLEKDPLIKYVRVGTYKISLTRRHSYYPDIFFLTVDGRIGIIEVKPLAAMADINVKHKYEVLKKHCLERNFMCFMCDNNFNSYSKFKHIKENKDLTHDVKSKLEEVGNYTYINYKEFKKTHGFKSKSESLDNALAKLCFENHYEFDMNGLGVYKFKIIKNI